MLRTISASRIACALLLLQLLLALRVLPANAAETARPACDEVEVFTAAGCPHCARALNYLRDLKARYPAVDIRVLDVAADQTARDRFFDLSEEFHIDRPGVPAFLMCGRFLVGFDEAESTGRDIETWLGLRPGAAGATHDVHVPGLGSASPGDLGLPLFTIVLGLVDGFNPCAMWVLLFLLSLLVNLRDRRRMLLIAGTFVAVSGAVYFAFMAAWLNLFLLIGLSRMLQAFVGAVAMLVGAVHVKDFFAWGRGVSFSIPEGVKPGLYARMRRVVQAENLPAAMTGVVVLAVLVNMVELLCTAGLPALYTQILAAQQLSAARYLGYLLLYNAAYVFDDALMVGVAVVTFSRYRLAERGGRWLKLLSGAVIMVIGAALLFAPELLV